MNANHATCATCHGHKPYAARDADRRVVRRVLLRGRPAWRHSHGPAEHSARAGDAMNATERYHVARTTSRGARIYAQSVDAIGADWDSTRVPLTRAQVAAIVDLCDTRDLDIRQYDTWEVVDVSEVQGYAGQDEQDEAKYDDARAWRTADQQATR